MDQVRAGHVGDTCARGSDSLQKSTVELRVVSNAKRDGMDVWLRLRTPNPLQTTLLASDGVARVEAMEDSDIDPESGAEMPTLKVSLD